MAMTRIANILLIVSAIVFCIFGQWQKVITVLLIIFCFRKGMTTKDLFSPYVLLIVPLTSYLLYFAELGPAFLADLQTRTDFLIVLCFTAIVIAFTVMKALKIKPVKTKRSYNENFWVICIIGLIPAVLSYILYGSVFDATGDAMLEIKEKQSLPVIGQLAYFLPASIIVACKNNNSKQIIIAVFLSFFAAALTLTKTSLLVALIFTLAGLYQFNPGIVNSKPALFIKKYIYIWLPVLVIYMFMANNSIRQEAQGGGAMEYVELSNSHLITNRGNLVQGLFLNYLYLCSPWSNLDYNVQRINEISGGSNSFAQFADKLGIKVETVEKLEPAFLNTHSFITDFYIDFGYLGAIMASFVLGCIIYFFYSKFYFSGDALLLAYYCLIAFATIMLFFSNHFVNGYLLNYLITFCGYYLIIHCLNNKKR